MNYLFLKKNRKSKKIIRWVIIPSILIFFWLILNAAYIIKSEKSSSILPFFHKSNVLYNFKETKILKNEKIKGEIKAEENYLGIISIRFAQSNDIVTDKITFRIKEKGSIGWYYERLYDARQFYFLPLYPFGFPIINNSRDKVYEFEIESKKGTRYNSVNLSSTEPVVISKYKFPKMLLLLSPLESYNFIIKKGVGIVGTANFTYATSFFLLPLLLYLGWQISFKNYVPKNIRDFFKELNLSKYSFSKFILALVFCDIFLLKSIYNGFIIFIILVWIFGLIKYPVKTTVSFFISLMLLGLSFLLNLFRMESYIEKSTVWSYLFLNLGIIHLVLKDSFKKSKIAKIIRYAK